MTIFSRSIHKAPLRRMRAGGGRVVVSRFRLSCHPACSRLERVEGENLNIAPHKTRLWERSQEAKFYIKYTSITLRYELMIWMNWSLSLLLSKEMDLCFLPSVRILDRARERERERFNVLTYTLIHVATSGSVDETWWHAVTSLPLQLHAQ